MTEDSSMPVAELDDRSWRALSDAVRGFEAAWKQSPEPDLAACRANVIPR